MVWVQLPKRPINGTICVTRERLNISTSFYSISEIMYRLTLTRSERDAFDWNGGRYASYDVKRVLSSCLHEDIAWSDDSDITFEIPEYLAWEMKTIREENGIETWTSFSSSLTSKLERFLDSIV